MSSLELGSLEAAITTVGRIELKADFHGLIGKARHDDVLQGLGFYKGCIDVWNSAIQVDSNCFSSRVVRSIKQMEELLSKYPISEPEDESVGDVMDSLRLKFRAICATLNVKLEYNGYPKSSDGENIQF